MIIVLYSSNLLVFVMDRVNVYYEVGREFLYNKHHIRFSRNSFTCSLSTQKHLLWNFLSKTQGKWIDLECQCIVQVKFVI